MSRPMDFPFDLVLVDLSFHLIHHCWSFLLSVCFGGGRGGQATRLHFRGPEIKSNRDLKYYLCGFDWQVFILRANALSLFRIYSQILLGRGNFRCTGTCDGRWRHEAEVQAEESNSGEAGCFLMPEANKSVEGGMREFRKVPRTKLRL